MDFLSVQEVKHHQCYLGLPTFIGRNKFNAFRVIKERVWKRVQGWGERFLSRAGKKILIKGVAQAIPCYTMSIFSVTW